jgi:adenosine deaminase
MLRELLGLFAITLGSVSSGAQNARRSPGASTSSRAERRAIRAFDSARRSPLDLHAFLERMPKGGDLHMHLDGAVYAETFLADARADLLCVDPRTLSLTKNIGSTRSLPPQPVCGEGHVPAADAFPPAPEAQHLYNALVDSFSMRSFVPGPGNSGHDQFFSTFGRFSGIDKSHRGQWLGEVATRAAAQNEQYLEIMLTPHFTTAIAVANKLGWPESVTIQDFALPENAPAGMPASSTEYTTSNAQLAHLRDQLIADKSFQENIGSAYKEFHDALQVRDAIEHCGAPNAADGCSVDIRFLYQVLRSNPPQIVFAQTLLAFEIAAFEAKQPHPVVIGLNFVQPEDDYLAMSEYTRQMRMLDYLHTVYPQVHIALHAGELAPGLVPPEGLLFHIREAIDLGHAERIGHGVDVLYEQDPQALLKEMAERHIMVEINLTSNDIILGISLNRHSLPAYRSAGVPTALSTDDEGVSRIDLTHEYARAANDFNLGYLDLKGMARTSIEHAFLPGVSLWSTPDTFTRVNVACSGGPLGADNPNARCLEFLRSSQKAAAQWQLEHRYAVFESLLP